MNKTNERWENVKIRVKERERVVPLYVKNKLKWKKLIVGESRYSIVHTMKYNIIISECKLEFYRICT